MQLKIEIPQNLRNSQLLQQRDIPCVCYIGRDFEIHLDSPLDNAVGTVHEWSSKAIDLRAPAGAGGQRKQCAHGRMTLRQISDGIYEIRELSMFYEAYGWLPVVADGEYAEPKEGLWDEE